MTLDEFKQIWRMEYIHRMWGRLIGVVFFAPAIYFWMKSVFPTAMKKRILLLGSLISCQGLMGWYMVKSGLENEFDGPTDIPRVSQYRLALHLSVAFIIYSGFFYTALDHLRFVRGSESQTNIKQLRRFQLLTYSCKGLILLTAISGAFVAGLDAGLIYNTFPKMADKWVPDDILFIKPLLKNVTENPTMVQFNHRILGILTLLAATCIGLASRKYKLSRPASLAAMTVFGTAFLQATLGVLTLVNSVPIHLAALHQSNSLFLLSAVIWLSHEIKYIKKFAK